MTMFDLSTQNAPNFCNSENIYIHISIFEPYRILSLRDRKKPKKLKNEKILMFPFLRFNPRLTQFE